MLGIDGRAARVTWTIVLIVTALVVTFLIRRTLLIFIIALLLAYLLSPLVNLVDRSASRRLPRNLSLAVVYLGLIALVGFGLFTLGARIAEEAASLAQRLPQYLKDPRTFTQIPLPEWAEPYRKSALDSLGAQLEESAREILPMLGRTGQTILHAFGSLVFIILVPILSFFFLKDSRQIRQTILDQFSDNARRAVDGLLADVHVMLAQFMRALVMLSLLTLVVYWIYFSITGVPHALLLAGIAGVLEFIPVAGPLTASIVILVVSGFAGYPHLVWILIFLIAFRLFQDYVVQPYLLGAGVELSPAAVIFGVLAGEQIAGVMGMFLSIPALATLRVIYVRFRRSRAL
ncbi:MAG: AI-2E family transporter [Bryobacteraceae bacterium]